MKKKYLFLGLGLWAIGSVVIVLHMAQGDIEAKVKQWLAIYSCKAEEVSYSLWSKELNIRGLNLSYHQGNTHLNGNIASVKLTGLNSGAFDATKEDRTPLADNVEVSDVRYTLSRKGEQDEVQWRSLKGQGLYLNLATSAQAMLKEKSLQQLMSLFYRYRIDHLVLEGYEMTGPVPLPMEDGSFQNRKALTRIEKIAFPDGLGARADGEKQAIRVSVQYEGASVQAGDALDMRVGKLELLDVYVPSLENLRKLYDMLPALERMENASEEEFIKVMKDLGQLWDQQLAFRKLSMKDMDWKQKHVEEGNIALEEMLITLDDGARTEMELSFKGLRSELMDKGLVQETGISPDLKTKYLPNGIMMDMGLSLSASALPVEGAVLPDEQSDNLKLSFGIRQLGSLSAMLELDIPDTDIASLLLSEDVVNNIKILGATVAYQDQGLIPLMMEEASAGDPRQLAALKREVLSVGGDLQSSGLLGSLKAVNTMLERPGKLSLSCTPDKPLQWQMLGLLSVTFPAGLDLFVSAEPGDKTLEELMR